MTEILVTLIVAIVIIIIAFSLLGRKDTANLEEMNLYSTALNHMLNGEDKSAIKFFKEIVRKNSDNVDAYIKLGVLFRRNGKMGSALKIHENLLLRGGISPTQQLDILRNLVDDYLEAGDQAKALSGAEKILNLDPKNIWALEKLQTVHRNIGQWDKAFQDLEKVLEFRKEKNDRLLALYKVQEGLMKYNEGYFHEARLIFRKAIRIDPICEAPYFYIANSYAKEEREVEAVEWWVKFADISPNQAYLVFQRLQTVLFNLGNFGKIQSFYENVLSRLPGDVRTITALAGFYERRGELEKALALIEELREKNPNSNVVKMALCKLLILKGRCTEANEILNDFVDNYEEPGDFICSVCGHREKKITWLCPICGQPDTYTTHL
ncbi:MAG: hypothetical protein COT43_01415 [Candidatus Marinimicrobia bacterium CG08_land_8_20_14_0_20_45_22]|nr:MAG: hypothetical protein COT43_01415 [Candidatus Marinimicrobia bacterium CG08_land_8_20_14_0_20_45_22]